jgi:hypothetical protein
MHGKLRMTTILEQNFLNHKTSTILEWSIYLFRSCKSSLYLFIRLIGQLNKNKAGHTITWHLIDELIQIPHSWDWQPFDDDIKLSSSTYCVVSNQVHARTLYLSDDDNMMICPRTKEWAWAYHKKTGKGTNDSKWINEWPSASPPVLLS